MGWRYERDDYPPPDYRYGFPGAEYYNKKDRDPLKDARWGVRFAKALLAEEERKSKKKKDAEPKGPKIPTFTPGQLVAIMMISWPVVGMFEKWMVSLVIGP